MEPLAHDFRGTLRDAESTRRFGQSWAASLTSLAIYVPSVIIPAESNVLVNPVHDAFQEVVWDVARLFEFDPRLLRGSGAIL
jgi:RES domain-containing protein